MGGQGLGNQGADAQGARHPKVLVPLGLDEELEGASRHQPCHLEGDSRPRQFVGGHCFWFIHGDEGHLVAIHGHARPRPAHTEGGLVACSQAWCHCRDLEGAVGSTTAGGAGRCSTGWPGEAGKAVAAASPAAALVTAVKGASGLGAGEAPPALPQPAPAPAAPCLRDVAQSPRCRAPGASLGPPVVPALSLQRPHFSLQLPQAPQHCLQCCSPTRELWGARWGSRGGSYPPLHPLQCQHQQQ